MLTIANKIHELNRPALFAAGAELWNDPHISGEMLKAHLSPDTDAASYKPAAIAAICRHLPDAMGLKTGASLVDLGCGPGLYAKELGTRGFAVTGIDRSEASIRYARELNAGPQATFLNASYLQPFGENRFDAAIMVSLDYGVLSPENRRRLLNNVHAALKPGGYFALDVESLYAFSQLQKSAALRWEAAESGFWRPHPYVALSKTYLYPELPVSCALHAVLDEEFTVYRIWQTFFSPQSIAQELSAGGFAVRAVWGNLMGGPQADDSQALGVLCQKA